MIFNPFLSVECFTGNGGSADCCPAQLESPTKRKITEKREALIFLNIFLNLVNVRIIKIT
jgi:hypothetical protein